MQNQKKNCVKQEITDQVLEIIETNENLLWDRLRDDNNDLPRSLATGKNYSGVNIVSLTVSQIKNNFQSSQWITFNQAKKLGGKIKKGSKSSTCVTPTSYTAKIKCLKTGKEEEKKYFLYKKIPVFNVAQVEGIEEVKIEKKLPKWITPQDSNFDKIKKLADRFAEATDLKINYHHSKPSYFPDLDTVCISEKSFETSGMFAETLAHELVHSTLHKKRLNRKEVLKVKNYSGDKEYAFEELVAELGACFILKKLSIKCELKNSAAYMNSYLKNCLKDDKNFLISAASHASKACDYILQEAGFEKEEKVEN